MARTDQRACAVCGTAARAPFQVPMPDGPPDLDLRPGEPARASLAHWIQTCRACQAAAPDLAALPLSAAEIVRSENYRWLERHATHVRPFLRWARLCPAQLRGEVFLMAAWSEDDADNADAATVLRQRALRVWGEPDTLPAALRRLDVLRRTENWEAAAAEAARLGVQPLDETSAAILRFQQARIAERDTGRHNMASALPPPANRPHVSHGRGPAATQETKGNWVKRLLGR